MDMRKLLLILSSIITTVILGACSASEERLPFKGYWYASASADSIEGDNNFYIRLDFYDSTVCADGFENVLGVMSISMNTPVYKAITADVIKEATVTADNEAEIKYVQQRSGQLWSGRLLFDPKTRRVTFVNGQMIATGHNGDTVPVDQPYSIKPASLNFEQISKKPNYKEIPAYHLVLELPDRVYYRNVLADETIAPPFGDMQLRCYYPETDKDINITNALGDSPLSSRFNARIIDCWKTPGENGLMLIIWSGGRRFQEFTLYRVDDSNIFKDIDYTTGRRNIADNEGRLPAAEDVATIMREGREVRVYDPRNHETRMYDLAGKRIE